MQRNGIVGANCHVYGPAWRGVAWRGVAWRGVAWRGGSETRSANSLKTPESHFWPPSAPGQRCCPVVEPHSARAAADAPAGLRRTRKRFRADARV
ncbi:hypothetical protein AN689_0218475 [Enterobacter asburiae]|nr:hypothetical protein AL706_0219550 [Enterobacter asburiae]OEH04040.1 hypothetical protein AN689_0218475 [Enterobacter asburiae]